jgi:hypothetical protein
MMKLVNVRAKAKLLGISDPADNRDDLIRQIQKYEGYTACFKSKETCAEKGCSWYQECIPAGK